MLKLAQTHPILSACAVVAAACLVVMLFYGELTIYAWPLLGAVGFIATVVLSYRVFGATPNSSIYRPGANSNDRRR
jgi:hypothetical protein